MSTGRATVPAEFYDITSGMLLKAPLPQYLHAKLIMDATGAKLDGESNLALPIMGRALPSGAAPYANLSDEQLQLSEAIASDAIVVVPDFKPEAQTIGHTIRMNRPKFTSTVHTMASREVPAGTAISTTPVNIGSDQASITVKRWSGPYDSANSRIAPYSISKFDAGRSLHSLSSMVGAFMLKDFTETIDTFGVALFDAVDSANVLYANSSMSSNDSSVVAGDFPFTLDLVLRAETALDVLNIPYFSTTRRRMMIVTPLQSQQLKGDSDWKNLSQYFPEMNAIYSGAYVGSAGNFDVLKSNTLTQTANNQAVPIHHAQAFGPGMVGVGPAGNPYVTPNTQDNYGEDTLAVWLWYCAFSVLDSRFGLSLRTS